VQSTKIQNSGVCHSVLKIVKGAGNKENKNDKLRQTKGGRP
jgi:hypothetical protein